VSGLDPGLAIGGQPAGGDQQVGVEVVEPPNRVP
jgi:hypothetical protein